MLSQLTDISLNLPVELVVLWQATIKAVNSDVPLSAVDNCVQKYAAQSLLRYCTIITVSVNYIN